MPLRPILRLLLAGLVAGTGLLAPWPGEGPDTPPLTVGYQVAHADGPGDWSMFRHDLAHTGYNPNETQLKPPLRLKWSYTTEGMVDPSPAVTNGVVYVGSWDGKVYALDAATGVLRWSYATGGYVYSSPAVANGLVYVGSHDRKVYALDAASGALRWSYTTGSPVYSSPAVANGVVYVGSYDGKVYALDAASGALRWSYTTWGELFSSPAVANGVVYVGSHDRKVYALDATTGALKWSYTTAAPIASSPAVANGAVYVAYWDGEVYAFEAEPPPVSVVAAAYAASSSFPTSWSVPSTWTGTAAGSYDVQYRDGAAGAWADVVTSTTSLSTTFTGGQDGHTYYFRARATTVTGVVGDWSQPGSTTVDLTPPTGTIVAQGWSSPYISNTVTLSVSASDATSGVSQMQFGGDGEAYSSWESYAITALYVAPPGATAVYGRFKDNAGNVSQAVSATITLDDVSPTGTISVNAGAAYANALTATLTLSSTDNLSGISSMAFSNNGSTWSDWQGFSATKSWPLASGTDGTRTAYARFRDAAQNVSPVYSDTIILDTTAPTGTITINGGALETNSTAVTLTLSAADALSGLAQRSFSNDGQSYAAWEDYATTRSWTIPGGNGAKTVYARFRDNAGNVSQPYTDTIVLNTDAPSSAVDPLSLYQSAGAFTVTWQGTVGGTGPPIYDIQYKDGAAGQWTDWITSTLSTSAVFTGTEGHTYYFQSRARDLAGNVEPYVGGEGHTRTSVDLTPPTGSLSINNGALDTPSASVTLVLSATDSLSGISQVSVSSDGNSWGPWEGYGLGAFWPANTPYPRPGNLPSGDGDKTVWARFRDVAGNVSSPVSDTIRLDTSVAPTYGFSLNEGALFTSQVTVTLDLPANPNTAQMMVSNDGGFYGASWEPYAAYKAWAITQYGSYVIPRTVYVKYRDVSGNVYGPMSDEIVLDLTAPSGSVSIEGSGAASRVESRESRVEPPMPPT